jgi:cell wall-associated NlpC family hydrolase
MVYKYLLLLPILIIISYGCQGSIPSVRETATYELKTAINPMGYSIQAGAFSDVKNAARLALSLREKGFDAYYFLHDSGLYKVRFGNYVSFDMALNAAKELQKSRTITEYLIIKPEAIAPENLKKAETKKVRREIVSSAEKFLGVPYYWGGVSEKTGFDCSGLTMAVYKLNGYDLPRTTLEQWVTGNPVDSKKLSEGDLVFFSINEVGSISHVGIYVGSSKFIHAPGEGKKIQIESLSNKYFQSHYVGARTYLK